MRRFFKLGYVCHFRRPERMQFYRREFLLDLPECSGIEIQPQLRMMTALQKQLIASIPERFSYFFAVSGHIGNVGFGMARYAVKITELTIGDTDIGRIHIAVDLPGDLSM